MLYYVRLLFYFLFDRVFLISFMVAFSLIVVNAQRSDNVGIIPSDYIFEDLYDYLVGYFLNNQ